MKKVLLLLSIVATSLSIQAKDILHENVPAKVRGYITKNYPKAGYIEWDDKSKKGYYEAEFMYEGREVELEISTNGELLKSNEKENISSNNLPSSINKYIEKNYGNAHIVRTNRKTKNGRLQYFVKIRYENSYGNDRYRSLVFDNNGNVIKG